MKKSLFDLLSKTYGDKEAWVEVESVLKTEGIQISIDDFFDPFKNLVIGILSQNTSDKNCTRAYIGLAKRFEIKPHVLANADEKVIRDAIKAGGLYNIKARRIKNFSKTVLEKFSGDLTKVMTLPKEEARKKLLELPGIGPKTADVCLAYCASRAIIPVDTNIDRVVKRLGLVSYTAKYEEVQKRLEEDVPPEHRVRVHELLVRLGRDYCKPRNPLCSTCPVAGLCKKVITSD